MSKLAASPTLIFLLDCAEGPEALQTMGRALSLASLPPSRPAPALDWGTGHPRRPNCSLRAWTSPTRIEAALMERE